MIRRFVTHWLAPRLIEISASREPDFIVEGGERPYLLRWWLIPRNAWFNIYLHKFLRSDDDRALHDHPWVNLSVLLTGAYAEHTIRRGGINVHTRREAGDVKLRMPWDAHRIELTDGCCWTLFITGPRIRAWGFHCPKGWVHWERFTAPGDAGAVGRGCGEQA